MSYYLRVLSTTSERIPLPWLQNVLASNQFPATLTVESGAPDDWTGLLVRHADGAELAVIERNVVEPDSLGAEELARFSREVADCQPLLAAQWLLDYFSRVHCIYAFQALSGTGAEGGWAILQAVRTYLWSFAPGILQSDAQSFSNEEGYHILWQFSDPAEGHWWMAVLRDGQWKHFQMDIGNRQQREAFCRGQIPDGALHCPW